MAYFAKINNDNIVEQVIVVNNSVILDENNKEIEQLGIDFCKLLYGQETNWKQTFENNNLAGEGMIYDDNLDAFYLPQPFPSWTLNEEIWLWEAPVEYPSDGKYYTWNEETISWDLVTE